MKKFLIGAAVVIALLVGGFFLLNHYIYQEKQADTPEIRVESSVDLDAN